MSRKEVCIFQEIGLLKHENIQKDTFVVLSNYLFINLAELSGYAGIEMKVFLSGFDAILIAHGNGKESCPFRGRWKLPPKKWRRHYQPAAGHYGRPGDRCSISLDPYAHQGG